MRLKFDSVFKSLAKFETDEMPNFVVITGKNGSGKSQLVELFKIYSQKKSESRLIESDDIQIVPAYNKIYTEPLVVHDIGLSSPSLMRDQEQDFFNRYREINNGRDGIGEIFVAFYNNEISRDALLKTKRVESGRLDYFKTLVDCESRLFSREELMNMPRARGLIAMNEENMLINWLVDHLLNNWRVFEIASIVANYQEKKFSDLTMSDFMNSNIPMQYYDSTDLIYSKLERVFYSYLKLRYQNSYQQFMKKENGEQNNSLSREEFDQRYEAPWKVLNGFFEKFKLPYEFKGITEKSFSPTAEIQYEFIRKDTEKPIPFQFLSSGEKIIIGLVIKLFTSEYYERNFEYPDVIILDEPDAHLHPEMSKILIDVLNGVFVEQLGIKVIITTHSPMTIALAPEDSIYQLSNVPFTQLKQISKDEALKTLTSGLPNLSIDYQNHRQVFVEGPTDLKYYQQLFDKINADKAMQHKLYFISNSLGKGNCDQVINVVKAIRNSGNTTAYGVIDWDLKNNDERHIYVHGNQSRYSIENFVFDPIYLATYLLDERYGILMRELGISETDNQYDLIKSHKAQEAVNFVLNKLTEKFKSLRTSTSISRCRYGNEIELNIPEWYLTIRGHDLFERLKETFEPISKFANENELHNKMINMICKLYPNIPAETTELLVMLAS
ncbi:MAG: AAA family ATPase [Bacteroidetes bacterium]|nr:AAA family ATPase [Bacteroidota bacterium]